MPTKEQAVREEISNLRSQRQRPETTDEEKEQINKRIDELYAYIRRGLS